MENPYQKKKIDGESRNLKKTLSGKPKVTI